MSLVPFKLRATVAKRSEAHGYLKAPGDAVLVERGKEPIWLLLKCPCGCGEEFPINLDERAGPAWHLYHDAAGRVSIYPSVWRESGCESHYIIWRNNIWLIDGWERDEESVFGAEVPDLSAAVLASLSFDRFTHHLKIAQKIDAIPWDVLSICRQLKRENRVVEGTASERGAFKLRNSRR